MELTAVVRKGEKYYVALCPETDVVSQGKTIKEALKNLKEAVELYIEVEGIPEELSMNKPLVTHFEVKHGKTSGSIRN